MYLAKIINFMPIYVYICTLISRIPMGNCWPRKDRNILDKKNDVQKKIEEPISSTETPKENVVQAPPRREQGDLQELPKNTLNEQSAKSCTSNEQGEKNTVTSADAKRRKHNSVTSEVDKGTNGPHTQESLNKSVIDHNVSKGLKDVTQTSEATCENSTQADKTKPESSISTEVPQKSIFDENNFDNSQESADSNEDTGNKAENVDVQDSSKLPFDDKELPMEKSEKTHDIKTQKENSSVSKDLASQTANEQSVLENSTKETKKNKKRLNQANKKPVEDGQSKPMNILDLQSHFENLPLDGVNRESIEFINMIKERAAKFEKPIENYSGTNYSVEYFVIDENLMRLLEELDKVKLRHNRELLKEKIAVIHYISTLQKQLDERSTKD